jgi:bifunctional non-homologous end joining protein LigD
VRCPAGREGSCFYQKHLGEGFPRKVERVEIEESDGAIGVYGVAGSLAAVVSLVQMGVLEIHTWGCRRDRLERPDRVVFDVDPAPGLAWEAVVETAVELRATLDGLGLASFVKTTGGKGLHVVVPLVRRHGWDAVKAFSRAVADRLVRRRPDRYLATASKQMRQGKIFLDYLRNTRGATAVAAYSTRARAGAPGPPRWPGRSWPPASAPTPTPSPPSPGGWRPSTPIPGRVSSGSASRSAAPRARS